MSFSSLRRVVWRPIKAILWGLNIAILLTTLTNWAVEFTLSSTATLNLADSFIHFSGTITIDPLLHKILLLHDSHRNVTHLPMTPKRGYESSQGAAERAVLEKTDLVVCQYSLPFMSFAQDGHVFPGAKTDNEPFALVHDENGANENGQAIRRLIYWYITNADSTAKPLNSLKHTTHRNKEEVIWANSETAMDTFPVSIEREVIRRAIGIFQAYAATKGEEGTKGDVCMGSAFQAGDKEAVGKAMEDAIIEEAWGEGWKEVYGDTGLEDALGEAFGEMPDPETDDDPNPYSKVIFPQFM